MTDARRAVHRLASRLGRTTEELERMTARELNEWLAVDRPRRKSPTSMQDFRRLMKL